MPRHSGRPDLDAKTQWVARPGRQPPVGGQTLTLTARLWLDVVDVMLSLGGMNRTASVATKQENKMESYQGENEAQKEEAPKPFQRQDRKMKKLMEGQQSTLASGSEKPECIHCGKRHGGNACWRMEGRCLKCGSKDHRLKECPNQKTRFVSRDASSVIIKDQGLVRNDLGDVITVNFEYDKADFGYDEAVFGYDKANFRYEEANFGYDEENDEVNFEYEDFNMIRRTRGGFVEGFWGNFYCFGVLSAWFQHGEVLRSAGNVRTVLDLRFIRW
ncbi:hypothetical protein Taro_000561 [Colocasia esculenta]|uniref:CCHC-type domain-containing protein n=1 Tax=Colocasia esculenta TaxID=4460 RepID=A0A843TCI4_COLES|nr:hypothetical protein [Colocasia esculenta]